MNWTSSSSLSLEDDAVSLNDRRQKEGRADDKTNQRHIETFAEAQAL